MISVCIVYREPGGNYKELTRGRIYPDRNAGVTRPCFNTVQLEPISRLWHTPGFAIGRQRKLLLIQATTSISWVAYPGSWPGSNVAALWDEVLVCAAVVLLRLPTLEVRTYLIQGDARA
jgi:hypothetical protein